MTAAPRQPATTRPARPWAAVGSSVATVALLALMVLGYYEYFPSRIGAAQPIPFSHKFHVTEKRISCLVCHTGVLDTPRAGVPPLETCMLCHKNIITTYPKIEVLRQYYEAGVPVPWVRVNHVPEFVYFNHEVHIRKGFDCGRCHGDVAHMDRVDPSPEITMGFCVQCHRDEDFSHDCLVCHR
jgi:hypothetical protein